MFQYLTVLTLDMLCHRVYPTSHIIQIGQSFPFFHPSVHRSQPAQRLQRAFHRLDRRRFGRCGMGETWWKEGVVLGDGLGKIVKFDDLYTSRSRNSIAYHHNETLRENGKYTCFKPWYWWYLLPWHIFVRFGFRHLQLDQLWRGKTCQQSTCASPTGVWPSPVDWHGLGLKRRRHQDSLQWVGKTNICLKSCNWLIDWLNWVFVVKIKNKIWARLYR